MRTAEQANATNRALQVQQIASKLTAAMASALLNASGTVDRLDLTGETVADYCTGHETLRGDLMGASLFCEGRQVCKQAVDAYRAEREPDQDVLHVRTSDTVRVGTVIALIQRGLLQREQVYDEFGWPQHLLSELGYEVRAVLRAAVR
jgi:hypothetical protein